MDRLKAHYGISLRRRLETLESLLQGVDAPTGSAEVQQEARQIAHTLKGSGATYGFEDLSRVAAEAETAPEENLRLALCCLMETIRQVIAQCPPPETLQNSEGDR